MKAPLRIETSRLVLRKPVLTDAAQIFDRYASDAEVTRYMSWQRHRTLDDTRAFLSFSDAQWDRWPAGAYLIDDREGRLLGGTGLGFETPETAITGYILAKDSWGLGYATEALRAMVELAKEAGVRMLTAEVYHAHQASIRVLEKGGFRFTERKYASSRFPNVSADLEDALRYEFFTSNL